MNELFERYQNKLNLIEQDEAEGKITSKQAEFSRNQLTEEYQQCLAEFDAAEEEVVEFAAGNSLGATLLELGEEAGYEDPEEYLIDLSDALGIDPEEAYDLITSEEEPDEELVEDVLDALLPDEEEDEYDDEEDEVENDEEYEDEGEDDDASYSNSRLNELEEEMAEFKLQQDLKYGLSQLRNQAQDLLENGCITTFGYNLLFPDVESDDDLVASFSKMAERNESDIATQLSNIQAVISFCRKTFPEGIFNDYIRQEQQASFSQQEFDPEEDATIKATADYILKNLL